MPKELKKIILDFMKKNEFQEYSMPDFQKGLGFMNREHLIRTLTELEMEDKIDIRIKGRTRLYHLVNTQK